MSSMVSAADIVNWLVIQIATHERLDPSEIDTRVPFSDYGLGSMAAIRISGDLEQWLERRLSPTLMYDYPSIESLAHYLAYGIPLQDAVVEVNAHQESMTEPVAIIGLGCRFPGAANPEAFWQLLSAGEDAIGEIPVDRWGAHAFDHLRLEASEKLQASQGGFLDQVDLFDPHFFGISPREAIGMDPQQRLLLEVAWETLENAGQAPEQLAGSQTGIFLGISNSDYVRLQSNLPDYIDLYDATGNAFSIAANRLSYLLDVRGPSLAVDTACSSSLVAVHLACQSLRTGEATLALAGGVNMILSPDLTVTFAHGQMVASDGHCKTFDASADGYVRSEGCGLVALKLLSNALQDGDQILATIRGSAVNQDGRSNGLTAPNGPAQQTVIRQALRNARVTPDQIGYVEAHGSGTALGDPIEMQALEAVLSERNMEHGLCLVGSVKTNIGHLEAAAGIAGLIKAVLALQHRQIPPHLHLKNLNPRIHFTKNCIAIPTETYAWSQDDRRRRFAGVSSFGLGGTNAHVVLEEAPERVIPVSDEDRPLHVFALSAKSDHALRTLADRYVQFLASHNGQRIQDICFTANVGRSHFTHRFITAVSSPEQLQEKLHTFAAEEKSNTAQTEAVSSGEKPRIAFLYTGQGSQYVGMGYHLYVTQPTFRRAINQCAEILHPFLKVPLLSLLHPRTGTPFLLEQPQYNQPMLFALEYALTQLWKSWGIEPDAVLGHGPGEYAAACSAGVFSLEDGLMLVTERGKLMQALEQQEKMEPIFDAFDQVASSIHFLSPEKPLISSVTGQQLQAGVIPDALYWRQHLSEPVRFSEAIHALGESGCQIFIELGPRSYLLTLGKQHFPEGFGTWLPSLMPGQDDWQCILKSVGMLYVQGVSIDWRAFDQDYPRSRISLPTYPFERQRYWKIAPVEIAQDTEANGIPPLAAGLFVRKKEDQPLLEVVYSISDTQEQSTFPAKSSRYEIILSMLTTIASKPLQIDPAKIDTQALFLEMGVNSLVLLEVMRTVEKTFGVKLEILDFFDDLTTLEALAAYVEQKSSLNVEPVDQPSSLSVPAPVRQAMVSQTALEEHDELNEKSVSVAALEQIMAKQLEVMAQQLEILQRTSQDIALLMREVKEMRAENLQPDPPSSPSPGPGRPQESTSPDEEHQSVDHLVAYSSAVPSQREENIPVEQESIIELPLLDVQKQFWVLAQVGNEFSACYERMLELHGPLDVGVLYQAFQQIVDRHEALRTSISADGNVQYIYQHVSFSLPTVDFSQIPVAERMEKVEQWLSEEHQRGFDLTQAPLFRTHILKLAEHIHILVLSVHHIIIDGQSFYVLLQEVSALYSALVSNTACQLPPAMLFRDYIQSQMQHYQSPQGMANEAYWVEQFAVPLPVLELPIDHPRPLVKTYSGARQSIVIETEMLSSLKLLSKERESTLFMLLLTVYTVLLHRLTGQDDVIVGIPFAGHTLGGDEHLIGSSADIIPIWSCVANNPAFVDALATVKQSLLKAYEHQPYTLASLIQHLKQSGDRSRTPVVSTTFNQNPGISMPTMRNLESRLLATPVWHTVYEISINIVENNRTLEIDFDYNTDLFNTQTLSRIQGYFITLLESIVAQPGLCVADLQILTPMEQKQLLVDWNATTTIYPEDVCVHHLFEQQVRQTPDAIALVFEQEHVTYLQLEQRANRLAQYLHRLEVGAEVMVGVCLENSLEMAVGVLGVLKAGATVVPIDPTSPKERLSFLFADARLTLLLTQSRLRESLPDSQTKTVLLDRDWEVVAQEKALQPACEVSAENLVYVIYTSGSTGTPKGVSLPHRVLVNLLIWHRSQLSGGVRALQFAPLSFDASFHEMFAAWCSGGTLCVIAMSLRRDVGGLAHFLAAMAIEKAILPVVILHQLAQEYDSLRYEIPHLKEILATGEQLQITQPVVKMFGELERCTLHNHYGPSESHVVTTYTLPGSTHEWATHPPIGRPIANTQIYVLDASLSPVPIGSVGELYIGGLSLARGYLDRPALTAERFLPHPFAEGAASSQGGARVYKTGDLARYQVDGTIEYLGRRDQQVKIRGYRVELGEIEVALRKLPAVYDAVVVAREMQGEKRLVAYVVGSERITTREVRVSLQNKLPEYMIPAYVVLLESIPLTPNGKVDRKGLPDPREFQEDDLEAYRDARTPLEELLREAWREVLGRHQIGIHDNFFEVGGHSLLATQLIARFRTMFAVEMPVRMIFEHPTIAEVAQQIEQAMHQDVARSVPPLVMVERPKEIPLSFAQQRLWFLDQLEPGSTAYLLPGILKVSGEVDARRLEWVMQELIQRHESLRTIFIEQSGQPVQVILPAGSYILPVIDLQGLGHEQAEAHASWLMHQESLHPYDLAKGPLVRTTLLRLNSTMHILLLTLHHIITDAWSNGILMQDFTLLYQAAMRGKPSPLAPLSIQYADYTLWQRQWLQEEELEAQLAYWSMQLAGVAPLELPTDHPRPAVQMHRGVRARFLFSPILSEQLVALSRQHNVTLFMLLVASFQILLARYTEQYDISVGTPIANRRHAELEGVVGFFLNTLVLRTDLSGDPTFEEVLHRVREVCLNAYAHQDIPFEKVVEELAPQRDMSRSPFFQVLMVLRNTPSVQFELGEGHITLEAGEAIVSHFDLTLFLTEIEQGLECILEYDTDLFEAETIKRLIGHWQTFLEGVLRASHMSISAISLLAIEERERLLVEWNTTQRKYPQNLCMHQLFEQQVQCTPDALAVVYEQVSLTYYELNRQANQLAHHLQRMGVGPEVLVGVCMERSPEVVVALLALLKVGGVYVPLDPSYPVERLTQITEDAQFLMILTQGRVASKLLWASVPLLCVDTERSQWCNEYDDNLERWVTAKELAYIIYTSGSTGTPKGAMIEQEGMLNHLFTKIEDLTLTSGDRVAQTASLSFDISVWQLLSALLLGGCTVIYDREVVSDPSRLIERLQTDQISIVELVPTFLQALLESVESWSQPEHSLSSIRWVVPTGEALSPALCRRWFAIYPDIPLLNAYGPTECSDDVASYALMKSPDPQTLLVPIGRPVSNLRLYVLDPRQMLVPIGITGELFVGGVGVGRGYLNDPQRTAAIYVPDPFAGEPGQRLYKTGDRVRFLWDGTLEFLGRIDQQVKIRGFRIELGEIETVLDQHPAVRECVVLAQDDPFQNKRLVAYVVPQLSLQQEDLASALREEQVAHWQMIFNDQLERQPVEQANDPIFNLAGWNSSYTREPIPPAEMAVWVDCTVSAIRQLRPRRVLEIGCGTGMLLFRLAPDCISYWGTDLSKAVIGTLSQQLERPEYQQLPVQIFHRAADELQDLPVGFFDLVILNSVVQYFPDVSYLLRVLHGALPLLTSDGHLFLGDIRSLPLLEAYHTSVQLALAPANLDGVQLHSRIQQHMQEDKELVLDPAFFEVLVQHEPELAGVQIFPKRGWAHNELTQFRYQVVLWRERPSSLNAPGPGEILWHDWQQEAWSLSQLEEWLSEQEGDVVGIRGIPNARLEEVLSVQRWLQRQQGLMMVGDWRGQEERANGGGVEPEAMIALAERRGYQVELSWRRHGGEGSYEALFWRGEPMGERLCGWKTESMGEPGKEPEWQLYANQPLREHQVRALLAPLRSYLQDRLPEYLIPAIFVPLSVLPLNVNGKVDRRALVAPEVVEGERQQMQQGARTPLEELLLDLWCEVLGRRQIGIYENFFDLGGHSLLATRLIARIKAMLGIEMPLRAVFETPTVESLAHGVEQSLQKGEALQMPPLVAEVRPDKLPLSFAQQRMWFLDQLDPGSTAYLLPSAFSVSGEIDVCSLERALEAIIRRHESLRTIFVEKDKQPVQVIGAAGPSPLPVIDLQRLGHKQAELHMRWLARQDAHHPYDLKKGPLLRTVLLRLDDAAHVLLLALHHVITDAWSNAVLVQELTVLYQSIVAGRASPLAPLPIQYADYALWQQQWLQGEVLAAQIAYWRTQLAGVSPLALPTDHPRPAVQTHQGTNMLFQFSPVLSDRLVALSQQKHVTLFMLLLATFQMLLARYSGQRDISVGSPIANRRHVDLEGVIGFFANTLVMRTNLSGDPTFEQVLQRVREVCLGAYAHQDIPFEKVVEELAPERDLSRSPLFQVLFVLQNALQRQADLPGVNIKPLALESSISKFDLTLSIEETGQGLSGILEYNTDLFEAETVAHMVTHWQTLLEGVIHNPQVSLSEVPLLTQEERELLLVKWNTTQTFYPQQGFVQELFEQQVQQAPEAVALVFEEQQLTYSYLNGRANQLAHHLQTMRVGPDVLVGICMERSLEMVIGLLGVLKAGGAYVPLDPSYPEDRIAYMLEDCLPAVVLTQAHLRSRLPFSEALSLDTLCEEWISESLSSNPDKELVADNLAYLIYTSGSTGRPKGVMSTHRGLRNRLLWMQQAYSLTQRDRVLQKTPFSFDVSVWEFFWPLVTGACLVMAIPGGHQDPAYLKAVLLEQQITTLHFVPAMLQSFLQEPGVEVCSSVRQVISSGEALTAELQTRFFTHFSTEVGLHNLYGPTEASIDVTFWACKVEEEALVVPIGRPIANTQIHILDKSMRPVPVGVEGELYIGGVGLARGYNGRADLTAEKFLANPFARQESERLYRTGDVARYRNDGTIEYLGRIDQQVKLRGFRIELGEIEALLQAHPAIEEGVVLAREDVPGDKRLVAYVVMQPGQELAHEELRTNLQGRLPSYMIPSAFVFLEALPLTSNGKIDRKVLPSPEMAAGEKQQAQQEARTPQEELLLSLWREVLSRRQVGIHDNFFELGGHSLLATRLMARVRAIMGVEIPLRALFQAPTVAEFVPWIEQTFPKSEASQMPALLAGVRPEQLPLSFAQQRLWFLDQLEPNNTAYLLPGAFSMRGEIDVRSLGQALEDLIERHESLRTVFDQRDGKPVQVVQPIGPSLFPIIDLQGLGHERAGEYAHLLMCHEAQHPCDLSKGPLLRVLLLRLEYHEHILLMTLHHIITDGWSNSVLMREFTMLYRAIVAGRPSPLTALPVQYADYALWQRDWLQGEVLDFQLAYWRTQLAGEVPLELPTDHPRPAMQSSRGAGQVFQLSTALLEQLVVLSRQQNVTLFMLLLASMQILLAQYSGQRDISVGTPIANRRHADLEGVVGFFLNTLVLRTDLSGDPTFEQVLHRVREVCLEAYAHQDIPFEKIVEELAPERDLSRTPLFQVLFVLQNTPPGELKLGEGSIKPLVGETIASSFDLAFFLTETEQGLNCSLDYNPDLFEAETIVRLLDHWQNLLQGVVYNSQVHLSEVLLLTRDERTRLLVDWNATQRAYPQDQYMHQLFEQQVEHTPDALAVVCEDVGLTYQELNRRANQLAHHLQHLGVRPETLVGVCMERSPELLIALLALFKAGGVYVPLDPSNPAERLAWIGEDAQFLLILIQERVVSMLPWTHIPFLCIDTEYYWWSDEHSSNPGNRLTMQNLAYVIYTSGSTGRPKGAMIEQQGMLNHLFSKIEDVTMTSADRVAQTASLSFDISVWQLLSALLVGGCTVIYDREVVSDPPRFMKCLRADQISIVELVPTFLQALLESVESWSQPERSLPHVRWVVPTGEALSPALARRWFAVYPEIPLLNAYGPTECSDDVASYALIQPPDPQALQVPIGHPVGNMRLYVLDAHQRVLPIGIAGELFVGGVGVGRGYLNDAQRTAAIYVPDPFAEEPGQRLYKTGDRVRTRRDGVLEFLGRMDQQVKIRGYRIELGEIEAALQKHEAIQEAVVLVQEEAAGEKRLIAYVVLCSGERVSEKAIRAFLQNHLPSYMLPWTCVFLDALPLTPNGKIDRQALPASEGAEGERSSMPQGARTPLEELLLGLWREVLGRQQIGIYDNFFELGGYSLLAMQLIVRIRAMLAVEVPLRIIFEEPTIASFAQWIEQVQRKGKGMQMPPLLAGVRPEELPLSFAQQRLWFLDQLKPGSTTYLDPNVLRISGKIDVYALDRALEELVHRHESLRTTFVQHIGPPRQIIHAASPLSFPVIDLQGLEHEQAEVHASCLAHQEAQHPCDLTKGPLIRITLLWLERHEHVLLLTLHHIITDGLSTGVLVHELTTLYEAVAAGQPSPLAPLPIQYADYALWQRSWLQGEVLQQHIEYWRKQLWRAQALELPVDASPSAVRTNRGASYSFTVSPELSEKLVRLSRQENVTLFMLLLAVFQVLLYRATNQEDIVVGTDVANRNHIETEGLIGFFVNQLVLRSHVTGHQTFRELVYQVRNMTMDAYLHQDIPFEKLVEVLRPERKAQSTPYFSVKMLLESIATERSSPQDVLNLLDITLDSLSLSDEMAIDLDLILRFFQSSEGMQGAFDYRADLFEQATIERMAHYFLTLLERICTNPDEPLNAFEAFTKPEKKNTRTQRKERRAMVSTQLKNIRPHAVILHEEEG